MALNLRNKIADSDTLTVFDVNENATKKLVEEAGSKRVQVASDPKEVAHKSVSQDIVRRPRSPMMSVYCSIYDLSWATSVSCRDFNLPLKANPLSSLHITLYNTGGPYSSI